MNVTLQRRLIHGASLSMLGVAVVGIAWAMSGVGKSSTPRRTAESRTPVVAADDSSVHPSPDNDKPDVDQSSRQIWSLALQQPLYDPPKPPPRPPRPKPKPTPKPVVKPAPKPPKLDWRLVGTLIEPSGRVAILADSTGKTDIRGADEEVELSPPGVLVRKIDSDTVTLEIGGVPSTLRLQNEFRRGATNDKRGRSGQGRPGRGRNR